MDIETQLLILTTKKQGNKELAIFYCPVAEEWTIELGNPTDCVMLGEVSGEISATAKSLPEAIRQVKEKLK